MTHIAAKVIGDSINESKVRLTTMIVTFPRIILAEFNTHRAFSRNSASSRAIPFEKMLKSIEENPFVPIAWQKDHKGMQGTEYLSERDVEVSTSAWLVARNKAIEQAKHLSERGATKQLCNRLLEPFMWTTVIVSATDFENFFSLRYPRYKTEGGNYKMGESSTQIFRSKKDLRKEFHSKENQIKFDSLSETDWLYLNFGQAEIHMMALAEVMWDVYNESTPKELKNGEWHIPFNNFDEDEIHQIVKESNPRGGYEYPEHYYKYCEVRAKVATAQCARVSYTTVGEEKGVNYQKDIDLHDQLLKSRHASPFEHCAVADSSSFASRNFGTGWTQYREIVEKNVPLDSFVRS